MIGRILAASFALLAGIACALAQSATDAGEHLFNGSGSTAGKVSIGATEVELNAKRFACRNCHRRDGAGGSEGRAPPIDWDSLSAATAVRPAYDRRSFAAALKEGVAPDRRPLDSSMPRYDLPAAVIDSLVAYLTALPDLQRRGIGRHSLKLGVVIAPDNRIPSETYHGYLEQALRQETGGARFFDRTVMIERLAGTREEILAGADSVAVVVGLVPSSQISAKDFTARGVPVLFPLALLDGDEDTSLVRGLMPALDQQIDALVRRAAAGGHKRLGIVGDEHLRMLDLEAAPGSGIDLVWLVSPSAPADVDALILPGNDPGRAVEALKAAPKHAALYGIAGRLPALPEAARQRHMQLTLVNGYVGLQDREDGTADLLAAHAKASAALVKTAILSAGRSGATRAALVAAFDRVAFPDLGLDYGRFPLTGTERMSFVPFPAGER